MAVKLHSAVADGTRHPIHQLTYPDAANRIAGTNEGTGATPKDYDIAKQDDDNSLWILTDATGPDWYQVAGSALSIADLTISGGITMTGGSNVIHHLTPTLLANGASINLPTSSTGFGFFQIGDGEEWAMINWTTSGTVTSIIASANTALTDTGVNLCFISGANPVVIKNRLGTDKYLMINYQYTLVT